MRNKNFLIRFSHVKDISGLVRLENCCFRMDRFSVRSFHYLITRAHGFTLVGEWGEKLVGYITVLFRQKTSFARLYSIAVDPDFRGKKIAQSLLKKSEGLVLLQDITFMRLEVRMDNIEALKFYQNRGYQQFGVYKGYYEDSCDALRLEKKLNQSFSKKKISASYTFAEKN